MPQKKNDKKRHDFQKTLFEKWRRVFYFVALSRNVSFGGDKLSAPVFLF